MVAFALTLAMLGACVPAGKHITMTTGSTAGFLAGGPHLRVSIGEGPWHSVQVDTGSVGMVVPRSVLGPQARDTGVPGQIAYTSSGRIFTGEYYLAEVAMRGLSGPVVQTVPIRVLGVDRAACDPQYSSCHVSSSVRGLGMMGVGFARHASSPANNALLQLRGVHDRSISPGYLITTTSITLGINAEDSRGFRFVQLQRNAAKSDWQGLPACFAIGGTLACGSALVDTGISGMILQPPSGASRPTLPSTIGITIPNQASPLISYAFRSDAPSRATPAAPASVRLARANGSAGFVNTGRNLLAAYDYLYDAACGRLGFRPR